MHRFNVVQLPMQIPVLSLDRWSPIHSSVMVVSNRLTISTICVLGPDHGMWPVLNVRFVGKISNGIELATFDVDPYSAAHITNGT